MNSYWFKRRRYGFGWFPITWEGWLSMVLYIASLVIVSMVIVGDNQEPTVGRWAVYYGVLFLLTCSFLIVASSKGPRPKWRWGTKITDNPEEDF